jgi:rod shape-determining protein MreC
VSAQVKRSKEIGSVIWNGTNPDLVQLNDVSRYKSVKMGDTIETSAYNKQYGEGLMIGIVKKLGIQPDQTFWDAQVKLATNFSNLTFVYVIDNRMQAKQDAIEAMIDDKKK